MKFGLFERRIRLEGEAYFEVTHNPRRPFVVEFEGGEIQVLGTSFNVKAYRDDDIVAVTLDEGRVVLDDRRGGVVSSCRPPNSCSTTAARARGGSSAEPTPCVIRSGRTT